MNGGPYGNSGDRGHGDDGILLSFTPFQVRLLSFMLSSLETQLGVVCLTVLEGVGLSFEMDQVPGRKISYGYRQAWPWIKHVEELSIQYD